MAKPWFPPNGGSALSPPRFTTGDSSNPILHDPPNPDNPLSLAPSVSTGFPKSTSFGSGNTISANFKILHPKKLEDKSLKCLAPVTLSDKQVPRVFISDSVIQKGAEIHKDFIICYFNGRLPPFNQIQSILNHMWGKEKRVEIHTNPLSRSMLVRIPFDYLSQKILEKTVWYVGESMFNAVQWSSSASASPPSLESIQIWAHLTGVPLDLRHQQGLSLVASLVGEPKETDDFTKNLVSLTLSHVKVVVDLTKPLPDVVEFVRQSGEVVEVQESYPWVPPTCSLYKELGHVARNCLHALPLAKSFVVKSSEDNNNPPSSSSTAPPTVIRNVSPPPPSASASSHLLPFVFYKSSHANPSPSNPPFTSELIPTKPSNTNLPPSLSYAIIPSPQSSPETLSTPFLKRTRLDPDQKPLPSFLAQLSYFSSIPPPILPLTLPPSSSSFVNSFSNTFSNPKRMNFNFIRSFLLASGAIISDPTQMSLLDRLPVLQLSRPR
ncbi:hypothetical protein DY000_02005734 [Brassica cretica]|uniref:DUF4283 domain-containing protein n=1 Tax=Brassica cretica TaxID=69181 RepID=A0ABQ7BYL6_BRACR|nr:hypothetical protein DY000_02005734 [Brassica cretica]